MGGSAGEGVGQAAETESTLALAENVYINLPCPGLWSIGQLVDKSYALSTKCQS